MKKNRIKQKILLVFLILFFCLLFLMIALLKSVEKTQENVDVSTNTENVEKKELTKKDIIEKYDSKYISEGVDYIQVVLAKNLFNENGSSNQSYIENLMTDLMPFYTPKDYYIVDDEKEIEVYARYNEELEGYEFVINKIEDFYSKVDGEDYVKIDNTHIVYGNLFATDNYLLDKLQMYDFYFSKISENLDEGIELQNGYTSYKNGEILIKNAPTGAVKNMILTEDYSEKITTKIHSDMSLKEVVEAEPVYGFGSLEDGYIGYRHRAYYLFFYEDEISIYTYSYEKNKDFENILKMYLESKDLEMFVKRLSKKFMAYDYLEYDKDTQSAKIRYSTRGVDINIKNNDPKGITFYSNYYFTDYTKSLVKSGVVSFEPDKDFVEIVEIERRNDN